MVAYVDGVFVRGRQNPKASYLLLAGVDNVTKKKPNPIIIVQKHSLA